MLRRVHLPALSTGSTALPPAAAHYIRDVLRLNEGDAIEVFDDSGNVAAATLKHVNSANVVVVVDAIRPPVVTHNVTIAAAIPKGDRADWMIEKLAELGVTRFIPLVAQRTVTLPAGRNKFERWERIAIEAAKQSRRVGTMSIAPLMPLAEVMQSAPVGSWCLSTAGDAVPASQLISAKQTTSLALIGPEGGWTDDEIRQMNAADMKSVALTGTVLRVETAAVLAAGLLCLNISPAGALTI